MLTGCTRLLYIYGKRAYGYLTSNLCARRISGRAVSDSDPHERKKKKKKKRINHAETKTKSDWPGESQMSKFQLIKTLFCCSLVLHLQFFSKKSDVASQVGDAADIRCARFERA